MFLRPALFTVVVVGLLIAAGCGPAKLNENRSYKLNPGDSQKMDLPAISRPQKITVDFSSSAGEVKVYLIKDFKENDGLESIPAKNQILDYKQGKAGNFTAEVPENTATRIVIRGVNEQTEVTLKVTNSK